MQNTDNLLKERSLQMNNLSARVDEVMTHSSNAKSEEMSPQLHSSKKLKRESTLISPFTVLDTGSPNPRFLGIDLEQDD